jgi:hypothetical protein
MKSGSVGTYAMRRNQRRHSTEGSEQFQIRWTGLGGNMPFHVMRARVNRDGSQQAESSENVSSDVDEPVLRETNEVVKVHLKPPL